MPRFTYNMLQSSRKRETNRHQPKVALKQKHTRDALSNRASSAIKPYKRSQKISLKERGFALTAMGPQGPHTGTKGSLNRMHKKSCNKASLANEERSHTEANKQYEGMSHLEYLKNRPSCGSRTLSIPFQIGCYSPGTEPDHIPYHLYLLVKEAVDIMKRVEWRNNTNDLIDLTRVDKKIEFFCVYFHSHLPKDWEYHRDNASSLIAGYDTIFAEGRPRYRMSGYTPLGDQVKREVDYKTGLHTCRVVDLMRIVHSRKTPTHETFMEWASTSILFYCKLCSCFGIDYQHLETASEDDVCLMNMGS